MIMREKLKELYISTLVKDLLMFAFNQDCDFIFSEHLECDDWLMENFGTTTDEIKEFVGEAVVTDLVDKFNKMWWKD